jgi:Squalene-hopene cyclase C-terminal domain
MDVRLRRDPLPALLACDDPALAWNVRHDLLGDNEPPEALWELSGARRIVRRQRHDGSWPYPGGGGRTAGDYEQLATYHALLELVAKYRMDGRHPAVARAAEYLLGRQAAEGDLRGIYGSQYSTTYTAAILAVLADAGLCGDPRVERCYDWLLSRRQDDGGWAIPLRTHGLTFAEAMALERPLEPDRAKPFSHLVTGMVLRALTAYRSRRRGPPARRAARLLATRLFQADVYPDRRDAAYWLKLSYPFRWTDAVSALDAIALAGLGADDPDIARALAELAARQEADGLWRSGYEKARDRELRRAWAGFAAARTFRRFVPSAR